MAYQRHYWKDYDESLTETQNIENGAVVTTEKLNEIESGIVSKADKTELLTKADKTYVDTVLSSIAQGGPRELFYSIAALKAKYPKGAEGTYLVFDSSLNDGAHSFMWKENAWIDLGVYQSVKIDDDSIENSMLRDRAISRDKANWFSENLSENLFDFTLLNSKGYYRAPDGEFISSTEYRATPFLPCKKGEKIYLKNAGGTSRHVTFFNNSKVFVSGVNAANNTSVDVPNDGYFSVSAHIMNDKDRFVITKEEDTPLSEKPRYHDDFLEMTDKNFIGLSNAVSMVEGRFFTTSTPNVTPYFEKGKIILRGGYPWYILTANKYYTIQTAEVTTDFVIDISQGTWVYLFYSIATNSFSIKTPSEFSTRKFNDDEIFMGYINSLGTTASSNMFGTQNIFEKNKEGYIVNIGYSNHNQIYVDYTEEKLIIPKGFIVLFYKGIYNWINNNDKETIEVPFYQEDEETQVNQYLFYDLLQSRFFFISYDMLQGQFTNEGTVYVGHLHTAYKSNNLNVRYDDRGAYANGHIMSYYNSLRPYVDYTEKRIVFKRDKNTRSWVAIYSGAGSTYQFLESTDASDGDLIIDCSALTSWGYVMLKQGQTVPATFEVASANEFVYGDWKGWIYLGCVNFATKKDYLNFKINNDDLYKMLDFIQNSQAVDFNKKNYIVLYGDSLSTMANDKDVNVGNNMYYPSFDVTDSTHTWWGPIRDKYSTNFKNMAWSGGRVTDTHPTYPSTVDLVNQTDITFEPNIVITMIGTNDVFNGATLEQFEKAMNDLVTAQRTKFATASIYLISLPLSSRQFNFANSNGNTYKQFNDIIKKICDERNCKYVDLSNVGVGQENYKHFFGDSGVHFNQLGMKLISNNIINQIGEFN